MPHTTTVSSRSHLALRAATGLVLLASACADSGAPSTLAPVEDAPRLCRVSLADLVANEATLVTAGQHHVCALDQDGRARCAGADAAGASAVPDVRFAHLDAGVDLTCGVRELDGAASCWGDIEAPVSGPQPPYFSVAAGQRFACGLRMTGEIDCWGDTSMSALGAPAGQFVSLSAGAHHACATTNDGAGVCWGDDVSGETAVPDADDWYSLHAGWRGTCGLHNDGRVECFGDAPTPPASLDTSTLTVTAPWPGAACARNHMGVATCWGTDAPTVPSAPLGGLVLGDAFACGRVNGDLECFAGQEQLLAWNAETPATERACVQ